MWLCPFTRARARSMKAENLLMENPGTASRPKLPGLLGNMRQRTGASSAKVCHVLLGGVKTWQSHVVHAFVSKQGTSKFSVPWRSGEPFRRTKLLQRLGSLFFRFLTKHQASRTTFFALGLVVCLSTRSSKDNGRKRTVGFCTKIKSWIQHAEFRGSLAGQQGSPRKQDARLLLHPFLADCYQRNNTALCDTEAVFHTGSCNFGRGRPSHF